MAFLDPWADLRKHRRAGLPAGDTWSVGQRGMLRRAALTLSTAFAAAAVVALPASLWLYLDNRRTVHDVHYLFGDHTAGLLYPLLGAFLLRRRPDNRVGWVLAATGIIGINGLAGQYAVAATYVHTDWPLRHLASWLNAWAWAPELAVPALLPLLFPDGTVPSRRWRPVAVTAISALVVTVTSLAFSHHPIDASDGINNPWTLTDASWLRALSVAGIFVVFVCSLIGLISLVLRTRRAQGTHRMQLQWLMLSVVITVLLGATGLALNGVGGEVLWSVALAAIPAGVLVAVLRHQMLDIELVLNRTIAYALLTGAVVIAYVASVSVVGEVAAKKVGIAAVAVVALLIAAARDRVQRAVDHALFGDRRDPYVVVDRLGKRMDTSRGPLDALEQMAVELRTALRLPYVCIQPDVPHLMAIETGAAVAGTTDVVISVHGERLGLLRVGRRHQGEKVRTEEQSVLADAARRAGALLQAAALVADLRASRDRIVVAREEERRRLRHDLHDGVGPQLAGLALQLDNLARRLGDDPDNAGRVQVLRDRLRDTVVEVRRVVDNLRPPALDDVGLVEAVRQQVAAYAVVGAGAATSSPLVEVTSETLPQLPAAVEVAAYRIITEAVANAVRHGSPTHCDVSISVTTGGLHITVADNGSGIRPDATLGVGLNSMSERAAEVGGTLSVDSDQTGTTLTAHLPLELS